MFGGDPTGGHEERVEEHEEITGRNEGKHSTNKELVTQVLDRRTQRDTRDPKSTKVTDLLREEALNPQRDLPTRGLESDRIYSEEAAVSHEEEIRWMREALSLT